MYRDRVSQYLGFLSSEDRAVSRVSDLVPTDSGPTIQAVETGDETIYVLRRHGLDPIAAHWPNPLLELEPAARRIQMIDHNPGPPSSISIPPSFRLTETESRFTRANQTKVSISVASHQRIKQSVNGTAPSSDLERR
jgi:hypothetical protein